MLGKSSNLRRRIKIALIQSSSHRCKNLDQILPLLRLLEKFQIHKGHLGSLQFMVKIHQLLDKLRILLNTAIDFKLSIIQLCQGPINQHSQTDIVQTLPLPNIIEDKISSHLGKARHCNGKGSLVLQALQNRPLFLKRKRIWRNIKDSLTSRHQALSLSH